MYRYTLVLLLVLFSSVSKAELPSIGSANASALQLDQEYRIGQAWVRMLRAQASLLDDPVVESYLQGLLARLAPASELQDKRLTLVVIDSPEVNAFAAPGGVIGIHAGLIAAAKREDELASVIAHELAHLSQRHYAQQQAKAQQNTPLVIAGVIGGILLAGINADAGVAVYTGTLGASASSQLAFSRSNETDADQTGMKTLVEAGFSATAMARMFARLQEANRFAGSELPEFLRTHPVTQNRISDTTNRAQSMPQPPAYTDSLEFLVARARVLAMLESQNSQDSAERANQPILAYLLAVKGEQQAQADNLWQALNPNLRTTPWLQLSRLEQLQQRDDKSAARALLTELVELYPGDYAIQRAKIRTLIDEGRHADAAWLLRDLLRDHPNNTELWYLLAEVSGLNRDTIWVHRARIEYFALRGEYDLALRQLDFARRDARRQPEQLEWVNLREQEIKALRDEVDELFR